MASNFRPAHGVTEQQLADAAQLASLADETPEQKAGDFFQWTMARFGVTNFVTCQIRPMPN
jgi:high-affinity K+ transport system ATPase subunit B